MVIDSAKGGGGGGARVWPGLDFNMESTFYFYSD